MKFFEPYYPHFFTATILEWKHLLKKDKYKDVITSSLDFLTAQKRVAVYGFVIMANHIHLIWHILEGYNKENVQRDFMKFTAQQIKADLAIHHPLELPYYRVKAKDRSYQVWERNPLRIELYREKVIIQKLNYMHQNPVLCRCWCSSLNHITLSSSTPTTDQSTVGIISEIQPGSAQMNHILRNKKFRVENLITQFKVSILIYTNRFKISCWC